MNRLLHFAVLLVIFIFPLAALGQHWDTVYLNNGQVVFGELKGISLGKINFKMEDLTTTDIKINKVNTFSAQSRLFRIETVNKKVFFSKFSRSTKPGYVMVGDSLGGADLPIEYINTATYFQDKKNLFEGNVSAGYNYTKSSNIGRFNMDLTMKLIMKDFLLQNKSSSIVTQENKTWARDRESIQFTGAYFINSDWKAFALLSYQLNKELGLKFRFQQGLGAGYNIFATPHARFWTITGIVINQEQSFDAEATNFTTEIPLYLNFDLFKLAKPEISVAFDNTFFTSLTQQGRIRFDNEIRVAWKVITDFTLNLQFYSNYDSKPLSGTGAAFDYGIVFGIGYKWD